MSNLEDNKKYEPEPENFWKESGVTLLTWGVMVLVLVAIILGAWLCK